MGLLDPATSDGRVIFFLPWENMTIAGTTDTPTSVTAHPIPGEDDINFILREVRNYLSPDVEGTLEPSRFGPLVSKLQPADCGLCHLQCGEETSWQRGVESAPWSQTQTPKILSPFAGTTWSASVTADWSPSLVRWLLYYNTAYVRESVFCH